MALSRLQNASKVLIRSKMSEHKIRKLHDDASPHSSELRATEMALEATAETKALFSAPKLVSSNSSGLPKEINSVEAVPGMKKAKTGLDTKKKRKHIDVDEEEEFGTTASRRGPIREPKGWKEMLEIIEKAREGMIAPVDEVGADSLGDWNEVKNGTLEAKHARFRTLLALMLSSQTKDAVTAAAMTNLKKRFFPLTVQSMLDATEEEIDACINKVGFHNRKATYIKKAVQILHDEYDGDVPNTLQKITALPGVGPKMAFLLMQIAWDKCIGIGVDTHVHRLSNRFRWVSTKTPEETRESLQSWLPTEYWGTINKTLVGFGQMICLPVGPKCGQCPASHLCPSSTVPRSRKKEETL